MDQEPPPEMLAYLPVPSLKDDALPPTNDESDRLLSMAETEAMASDNECKTVTDPRPSDQGPEDTDETEPLAEALAADDEFETVAESRQGKQQYNAACHQKECI